MADANPEHDAGEDRVDDQTRRTEDEDAAVTAHADRPPTEDEERRAERAAADQDPDVGEHYREMSEIGAEVKGEGSIEG